MSHKAKLLRACAWNRCTLLMPTSAQHVQVGPVSKDGATQLSWLTDQVAFSFYMSSTNLTMAARPCVICSLSPLFFWSYLPLLSTISLQHGGLLGISQAHQACCFLPTLHWFFSSSTCIAPPGSSSLCPSRPPRLCSNVTLWTSQPWSPFKNFNLPLFYLLNLKPLSLCYWSSYHSITYRIICLFTISKCQ